MRRSWTILLLLAVLPHFGFGDRSKDGCDNCENPADPKIAEQREKDALEFGIQLVERAQHLPCKELAPGQSRVIDVAGYQSPSTIEHRYRLTRKSDEEFEATLNLRFLPTVQGSNSASSGFDESLHAEMKGKVAACLTMVNQALLGPDGKKLTLKLTESAKEAPQVDIRVAPAKMRADSRNYPSDISCVTITHELMHLLGLVDEYEEYTMGYTIDENGVPKWVNEHAEFSAFDCRAVGKANSLMNSHYGAFGEVFGTWNPPERILCTCSDAKCERRLKSGALAESIPKDATQFYVVRGTHPIPGKSLLLPAHFNAIVRPGCRENFSYYQCSLDAYRTSKEHKGAGCMFDPRPKACVEGDGVHWEPPSRARTQGARK